MQSLGQLLRERVGLAAAGLAALVGVLFASHAVWGQMTRHKALQAAIAASLPDEVRLQHLTWAEIAALQKAGFDRVLIPTGGTEQNGLHMVLGKHNFIVQHTAQEIARQVGQMLVAPVLAYVPEGRISPPAGHMKFAGTLSLPDAVFEAVLEHTARSLKAHGFRYIFFLGDSGGNQKPQQRVAQRLSAQWRSEGVVVYSLNRYYAGHGGDKLPAVQVESRAFAATHAGLRDTSELLFVKKEGVRRHILDNLGSLPRGAAAAGSLGLPGEATAALGAELVRLKIAAAVRQIRELLGLA